MRTHVHRLAAAGNAAALLIVVLFAAVLAKPFGVAGPPADGPTSTRVAGGRAERVVLVVIDGLRADVARDAAAMPFLRELSAAGGSTTTTARVEALIPSSVAGIITLATGAVPHPASFLHDFRAPPAAAGGLFQALAERGERSFVAGTSLWSDLYGRWAETAYRAEGLDGQDEHVLRAGLAALDDPAYRFAVFHFGAPDEAGHLHGAVSGEYVRAVRWCDDALRQIAQRAGAGGAIVVTSDHGLTDGGGHAGPEPEVLATPLVLHGPGFAVGSLSSVRQRDIPALVARALGVELPAPTSPEPRTVGGWLRQPAAAIAVIGVATLGAALVWARLAGGADGRPQAFWMNLALWACVALLVLGHPAAAAGVATLTLAAVAAHAGRDRASSETRVASTTAALALGGAWAGGRLAIEWLGLEAARDWAMPTAIVLFAAAWTRGPRPRLGWRSLSLAAAGAALALVLGGPRTGLAFAAGFGTAVAIGARLRDGGIGLASGCLLALLVALTVAASGQLLSLSTIDVRAGYHAAIHGGGLAAAVGVVVLLQAIVPVGIVLGAMASIRELSPPQAGGLFVGMSALPAGEALTSAALLLLGDDLRLSSLSLGCLLRAAATLVFLTCGAAAVLLARRGAAPISSTDPFPVPELAR